MAINVISLWNCQEAVSRTTEATSHGNCHSLTAKLLDVLLLIKHMTKDSLFCEQLGRTILQINLQKSPIPDLFADNIVRLATNLDLD